MSAHQQSHLTPEGSAVVALLCCIVQSLGESDDAFRQRFLDHLGQVHAKVRESPMFGTAGLEALTLARDLLKK